VFKTKSNLKDTM